MKFTILALHFFIIPLSLMSQPLPRAEFAKQLYQLHDHFREPGVAYRRFKHADLQALVQPRAHQPGFKVTSLGKSVQAREINLVTVGTGTVPVLLWSQMHGDEATATMALLDIFNFLAQDQHLAAQKNEILDKLTLHFIPMLNPDGAEVWSRRNALGIDLNRDALRLESPESKILKKIRDSLQPQVGFNLHDQRLVHSAGNAPHPATISFLAPAYDHQKSMNPVRGRAIKLIGAMAQDLEPFIPDNMARFDDTHEPRAFGDNMQKWGTSTILIESGGYPNDPERQYVRKLNFVAILSCLLALARQEDARLPDQPYWALPENQARMRPLLLRNVTFSRVNRTIVGDLAWDRREKMTEDLRSFYYESFIDDLGDLRNLYGYTELDCQGAKAHLGKVYPKAVADLAELRSLDCQVLLGQGFTAIRYTGELPAQKVPLADFPLNILTSGRNADNMVQPEANPDLVFVKGGRVFMAVINGFLYELGKPWPGNALVY
jgi:hypothetical protein